MAESIDEFMQRLRDENPDPVAYLAVLERELRERLRVNVGLLTENQRLKAAR